MGLSPETVRAWSRSTRSCGKRSRLPWLRFDPEARRTTSMRPLARCLARRGTASTTAWATAPATAPAALPAPQSHAPPPAAAASTSAPAKALHEIKSPMVGTFYKAEKPEAEPYVKVGSKVTPSTVVCMIEAMKLYNEIQAECTGTIVEVCVENAHGVEFGTVLFRVGP